MTAAAKPYTDWIGNKEVTEEYVSLGPVRKLLATLDDTTTTLKDGDPLPPLWQWMFFVEGAPQSTLGPDGHPPRGGFMPPVTLERRMFAGGRLWFDRPLLIGRDARQVATVKSVSEKEGRSGKLVFVTVAYEVEQGGTVCLREERDFVYRDPGAPAPRPEIKDQLPPVPAGAWSRTVTPDPVMLFRYSALTYNGHRIHYDYPYVTEVEHYPGVIVHGPLLATLLADLVRLNSDRRMTEFSFQARSPIYCIAPFRVVGVPGEDGTVDLKAEGPEGALSMQASARLA
jgi:3-methylfumaryl-CoA hydratase